MRETVSHDEQRVKPESILVDPYSPYITTPRLTNLNLCWRHQTPVHGSRGKWWKPHGVGWSSPSSISITDQEHKTIITKRLKFTNYTDNLTTHDFAAILVIYPWNLDVRVKKLYLLQCIIEELPETRKTLVRMLERNPNKVWEIQQHSTLRN